MKNEDVCVPAMWISKEQSAFSRYILDVMLKEIKKNIRDFGHPPKLGQADQLLMTLMCWREYRTEFHIGASYGISESAVCRTIRKIEDALIKMRDIRKFQRIHKNSGTPFKRRKLRTENL